MAKKAASKSSKARTPRKSKDAALKQALRRHVRANAAEYLKDENVTSVGVGRKNGDGDICLVFTVAKKGSGSALESLNTKEIPKSIDVEGFDVSTDVLERVFEPSYQLVETESLGDRKVRCDPIQPGISVSNINGSAGTIGLIVFDRASGAPCILSNWHVLHGSDGKIGDLVVQPGPYDDNDVSGNECGELLRSHLGAAGDCALSRIRDRTFERDLFELGETPSRMAEVDLDDKLVKSGRTTGVTYGIVRRTDVMVELNYGGTVGSQPIGGFEIGVDPDHPPANGEISMGGDSGSAWMIADGDAASDIFAGLHFAGESAGNVDEHALACYPKSVQKKLNFSLQPPADHQFDDDEPESMGYRAGFDARFLRVYAPMPDMSRSIKRDAVNFGRSQTIPYTHFSVCLSGKHRLARFVAWNVDGAHRVILGSHDFQTDKRILKRYQFDNSLYKYNKLDRGHIARRADLAWGPVAEARQSNKDSYFYTNIAPQHESFNQSKRGGIWGKLENLILEQADAQDIRISVIAGPLFSDDDPEYRGAKIPREYWKLIAYRSADGDLAATAFILGQNDLLSDIETLDLDPFRLSQITIDELADRTRLGFDAYRKADTLRNRSRRRGARREVAIETSQGRAGHVHEIESLDDVLY